jgi:ABC-2 type transport system ATP-binding protein
VSLAIQTVGLRHRVASSFEISDLDMHVPRGSVFGFLGPNGAGKTTVIRLLLGLLKPDGGEITILGDPMPASYASVLQRVGYVPERPHLYPSLTIGEAIRLHRAFYPTWDQRWADELVNQFNLDLGRKLSALSKGESGKTMMLMALAQKPELLVLDEPTDGLDPVVRRDILAALLDYVTDREATVLISSHLVHELERICDWVGLLDGGRMVTQMPMQEFKNGLKRLRVGQAPLVIENAPFTLLARNRVNGPGSGEQWLVRGWNPDMQEYLVSAGVALREVVDLDLEEGFVELLRSSRGKKE